MRRAIGRVAARRACRHALASGCRIVASTAEELAGRLSPLQVGRCRRPARSSRSAGRRAHESASRPSTAATMDADARDGRRSGRHRVPTIGRVGFRWWRRPTSSEPSSCGSHDSNRSGAARAEEPEPMAARPPIGKPRRSSLTMSRLAGEAIARSRLVDGQRDSRQASSNGPVPGSADPGPVAPSWRGPPEAGRSRRAIVEQAVDEVARRRRVAVPSPGRMDAGAARHSRGYPSGPRRPPGRDRDRCRAAGRRRRPDGRGESWSDRRPSGDRRIPGGARHPGMTGTRSRRRPADPRRGRDPGRPRPASAGRRGSGGERPRVPRARLRAGGPGPRAGATLRGRGRPRPTPRATLGASRTGTWELDIATGELTLSEEFRRLHGLPDGERARGARGLRRARHAGRPRSGPRCDHGPRSIRHAVRPRVPDRRPAGDRAVGPWRRLGVHRGRGSAAAGSWARTRHDRAVHVEAERDALLEPEREARPLQEAFVGRRCRTSSGRRSRRSSPARKILRRAASRSPSRPGTSATTSARRRSGSTGWSRTCWC